MPTPPILHADPHLPDSKREARQAQELGEVAPGDVMVLRPIDRKIFAPRARTISLPISEGAPDPFAEVELHP
jgi:hypothetical protein